MTRIPSTLRVLHQLQICPPSGGLSLGPQASCPSAEALREALANPRHVWDTRPSSELSSGFSLRLTHCPPAPKGSVCYRSLPSWGLCTAQRHTQVCSLKHPPDPGGLLAWLPTLTSFSPYPPQTLDLGGPVPEPTEPKPSPVVPPQQLMFPGGSWGSRWEGCGGVNLEGHRGTEGSPGEEHDSVQEPIQTEQGAHWPLGPAPQPQLHTHRPQSSSSFQSSITSQSLAAHTMPSTSEKNKDFKTQLSFCSQKANLDEKAIVPKIACTLGQRRNRGQGPSGTRSLPKSQDLL